MLLSLLGGSNYPAQFIQDSVLQVALAFTCQESNKNYKNGKRKKEQKDTSMVYLSALNCVI
jgi:hypothetical protein